jgi:phospholipid/cholesterol/gamma-HCH transport system substrate-binding protein
METRASYLLVGAFALVVMAAFVISVIWMAGANLREDVAYYDIFFDGSVTGLKPGNTVRYRGIPVGAVSEIAINPEDVQQVRVMIEVPADTPIKKDTIAALEYQGLTGVAFVQLTGGTNEAPTLALEEGQDRPVIRSRPSQLEELVQGAPELMSRITILVNKGNVLFGEKNLENIAATLENIRGITGALSKRSGDLATLIDDASVTARLVRTNADGVMRDTRTALKNMSVATKRFSAETKGVGGEFKSTLGDIRKTSVEFRRAAFDLADLLESNKEPFNAFASSGLYELTQLLSEMRILVSALTRVTANVESDPGRFLFGKSQPGVKVK